jgi:galactokinase
MGSPVALAAHETFSRSFGGRPTAEARAPGRVELLGNHTDYNGGLVLAAAIDRDTVVVGRPRADRQALVRSADFPEPDAFPLDAIEQGESGHWGRYVRGVVWALQERFGPLRSGFEAALAGNVPLGAGLSSSASLQSALALFLLRIGLVGQGITPDLTDEARMELAAVLRRSENCFVGVASGLLDQFSSLFGRAGHALWLDCLTLEHDRLPLGPRPPAIVVCDSRTFRRLADGQYNQRRAECERVVAWFQAREASHSNTVKLLRHISLEQLEEAWDKLDPVGRLRARHVLTENQRVQQGAEALRHGDLSTLGRLMSASHRSSRDDFANSSPALEALIAAAEGAPGFLGGKLSGAGWAGCTVNLVSADRAADFAASVRASYAHQTDNEPEIHICHAAEGATSGLLEV